jgi:DNA-directed RNA polymerase beta' subunit
MTGREGITDTALGTAKSGYIQRRIVKLLEDIQIRYDGSARNAVGSIYQLTYGENGFDPSKTVVVNNQHKFCDVSRLTNKLNISYESKISVN